MKSYLLLSFLFLSIFFDAFADGQRAATYERNLRTFAIEDVAEGKKLAFILDNDWVFECHIGALETSKLYALERLTNRRVRIGTNPQSPALELTFENPSKPGSDKTSFQVSITRDTYDTLMTVRDVNVTNGLFNGVLFSSGYITLSDHSIWAIKTTLGKNLAGSYWSPGDRVIVTRKYTTKDQYTLVNLDVSGALYVDYYKSYNEHFYSMRDPRSILVTLSSPGME